MGDPHREEVLVLGPRRSVAQESCMPCPGILIILQYLISIALPNTPPTSAEMPSLPYHGQACPAVYHICLLSPVQGQSSQDDLSISCIIIFSLSPQSIPAYKHIVGRTGPVWGWYQWEGGDIGKGVRR
jgi:hypothetical protein